MSGGGERGIVRSLAELVGNTPLVELEGFERARGCKARLLGKLEYFNPSGSIKDRAALNMIRSAEREGLLHPGDTIVEQSSGNTAIGLAAFANILGYKVKIFLGKGVSVERTEMLRAYGAELLDFEEVLGLTPAEIGNREILLGALYDYCAARPGHFFINQVENPHNPEVHVLTTGPEIWEATGGKVDVLVCMAGTGGTGTGLTTYLREKNPSLHVVLAQPHPDSRWVPGKDCPAVIDGVVPVYGVGEEDLSKFLSPDWSDECVEVKTEEAYAAAREVLRTDGLFLGASAAGALHAAAQVARRPENAGKNIVVIMADGGMKYLSTPMFA